MQPEFSHVRIEKLSGVSELPRLEAYLKLSDSWTVPALSSRVDLALFAEKILSRGVAILAVDLSETDIGVAAFYCNDQTQRCAYLTHLAVTPEHRCYGVGKRLLDHAKQYSRGRGMVSMRLEIYSNNESAKRFYLSCGFMEDKSNESPPPATGSLYLMCSLNESRGSND